MADLLVQRCLQGLGAAVRFAECQVAVESQRDLDKNLLAGAARAHPVETVVVLEVPGERPVDGDLGLLLDGAVEQIRQAGPHHLDRVDDHEAGDEGRTDGVGPGDNHVIQRDSGNGHGCLDEQRGEELDRSRPQLRAQDDGA